MHPAFWQRSTLKPLSLFELSFQVRLIWVEDELVAVRLLGGDGIEVCEVLAVAVLEYAELPALLNDRTR